MFPRPNRIIVPQYEPTPGLSLAAAAELLGDSRRAIAAQVVDFAVRGIVRVARDGKGFALELADLDALSPDTSGAGYDERDILHVMFPAMEPGTRLELRKGSNRPLGVMLKDPHRRIVARLVGTRLARERGWFERAVVWWRKQPTEPLPAAFPAIDHLWGVRDYIQLAEQDRFRMLQSPSGALTTPRGDLDILRLHERLLPYAVLFGLEKGWMRELDLRYRNLPPETLENLGGVLDAAEFAVHGVALVLEIAELASIVDAGHALEGVGAIFGGIGDVLGDLDLPSIDI